MINLLKQLLCGHDYKGGLRSETINGKKRYYSECKICGKKKYV